MFDVKRVETDKVGKIQLLAPGNFLGQYLLRLRTCRRAQQCAACAGTDRGD